MPIVVPSNLILDIQSSGLHERSTVEFSVSGTRIAGHICALKAHIAMNYRLAPQYPFPCAIQDFIASCALQFFSLITMI